ncbi:hypothetical protein K443DRAFT_559322 [Laccaria amethystina LaAM-08-1]|uniref:Uncharacterized protein n=1 Tax=Laccaria amethystina LaAM-08-1 TaxID=1095629 RepID=A0A0C9X8A4_9AGAR|nr:hypothetical protein K443DRAFT_559322 [Laccaria amethystina LaAM-08-1]
MHIFTAIFGILTLHSLHFPRRTKELAPSFPGGIIFLVPSHIIFHIHLVLTYITLGPTYPSSVLSPCNIQYLTRPLCYSRLGY